MSIIAQKISSRFFHYSKENHEFVAEASELLSLNFLSQIYDDACDVGFTMVSSKTGQEVTFSLHEVVTVEEDVYGWSFRPTTESIYRNPTCKDVTVLIVND